MLADADPDGNHIRTLLLRFFLLYMPEIITSGKLYASIPPLYGIKTGKGMKYFITKLDFSKYIQGLFMKKHNLTHANGSKMTNVEATAFFMTNIDYIYFMDILYSTFAVDPELLEAVLYEYAPYVNFAVNGYSSGQAQKKSIIDQYYESIGMKKESRKEEVDFIRFVYESPIFSTIDYSLSDKFNYRKFKTSIEKKFRFIEVSKNKQGTIMITGLVNSKSQTIILDKRFIGCCVDLIEVIHKNPELVYKLDGKEATIYTIMKAFNETTPNGLTRYKGLGEQDPEDLGESALRPDSNRTLVRYNIEDVKNEIEIMRFIDSNRGIILQDVSVTRQEIE